MIYSSTVDIRDLVLARIRRKRNDMKFTQTQAAERAGVNQQTWARWESGQVGIDLDNLQTIARVLEMKMEQLVALEPDYTETSQEIAERAQTLSERDQKEILALIRIKQLNRVDLEKATAPNKDSIPKGKGRRDAA